MEYIYVGKFLGTHGLKGEIKFKSDFKYLDKVFVDDFSLYIGNNKICEKFLSFRKSNDLYLVLLKEIDNIDSISIYVNNDVYVKREDLKLGLNDYVMEDFMHKKVYFNDKFLGIIDSIIDYGSLNYVMQIVGDKEILVPYTDHFIKKVDTNIYLKNMEVFINED